MSEEIPNKCRWCARPLRWDVLGTLSKAARLINARTGAYANASESSIEWARNELARVEKYRAEHKRGYEGAGDFCGQLCAASWAHSTMTGLKSGKYTLVRNRE